MTRKPEFPKVATPSECQKRSNSHSEKVRSTSNNELHAMVLDELVYDPATGAGNTTSNNETFEINLSFAF